MKGLSRREKKRMEAALQESIMYYQRMLKVAHRVDLKNEYKEKIKVNNKILRKICSI